jgi:hypothetical protein
MTPTAKAALNLIANEPGISIADLRDRLGVSMGRTWQIINILQYGRVRLTRDYAAERAQRAADLMHALVGHAANRAISRTVNPTSCAALIASSRSWRNRSRSESTPPIFSLSSTSLARIA